MNTHPPGLANAWFPVHGIVQMQFAYKDTTEEIATTTATVIADLSIDFKPNFGDSKIVLFAYVVGASTAGANRIRIARSFDAGASFEMVKRPSSPGDRREAGGGHIGWDGIAGSIGAEMQVAVDDDHVGRNAVYRVEAWTEVGGTLHINKAVSDTDADTRSRAVSYLVALEIRNP